MDISEINVHFVFFHFELIDSILVMWKCVTFKNIYRDILLQIYLFVKQFELTRADHQKPFLATMSKPYMENMVTWQPYR